MPIDEREANLHTCPKPIKFDQDYTHISIGDLHGNALKLIYTLIEEGVLKIDKTQYKKLHDIYLKQPLEQQDVDTFKDIISKVTVEPKKAITLIGDELADRGNNDYFTLLVLKKLKESSCNVDIIMSNHSMEFMQDYAREHFTGQSSLGQQACSLQNMHSLLLSQLIREQEVREIVGQVYTPMVKAIGYTISPDGQITLFSHAPIGLETVEALAKKFKIQYKEATPLELIQTIDDINKAIQYGNYNNPDKDLVNLFTLESSVDPQQGPLPVDTPLKRLTWNRILGDELRTETASGIKVKFVHGHIGPDAIKKNGKAVESHENLDNNFGKADFCFKTGVYTRNDKQVIVKHFTCHSSDILAHQLKDYMNANPEFNSIMTDSKKAVAMQQYLAAIQNIPQQYRNTISQMQEISKTLTLNAKINTSYKAIADIVATNVKALEQTGDKLFEHPITVKSIQQCQEEIKSACDTLDRECKKHRGWHSIDAGTRKKLGACLIVLSIISGGLFAIPALIIHCTTKGFGHTFFETPKTNTATAFHKIKAELDATVMQNLQKAQDMKAEVSALKPPDNHDQNSNPDTSKPTP